MKHQDNKPSQPPGEINPAESGSSPQPGDDEPPMEEKGMESTVDDKTAMPYRPPKARDVVIEVWHNGAHWSVKKNEDQYWYKGHADTGWKAGLPPGMTLQDAWRAFKEG